MSKSAVGQAQALQYASTDRHYAGGATSIPAPAHAAAGVELPEITPDYINEKIAKLLAREKASTDLHNAIIAAEQEVNKQQKDLALQLIVVERADNIFKLEPYNHAREQAHQRFQEIIQNLRAAETTLAALRKKKKGGMRTRTREKTKTKTKQQKKRTRSRR
jgi:uncharacterized membrane protein YccC